jgi:hypothetical protein
LNLRLDTLRRLDIDYPYTERKESPDMNITGQQAAKALRDLTASEIDGITDMNTRGDDGWQRIVTGLRDAVAEAFESDRFDGEDESDVIHEIADGQVPIYNSERMREVAIIGAAWNYETEYDTTGADLLTIIGYVLCDVYRDGAAALVQWVQENVEEDETDDADKD